MPKPMHFQYPLSAAELRLFRDLFRRTMGDTLFYVSDSFIQSTFQEFQDNTDEPEALHQLVLDCIAMAESCHVASRRIHDYANQQHRAMRPCPKCGSTGIILPYMNPCPRCDGVGRIPSKSRL